MSEEKTGDISSFYKKQLGPYAINDLSDIMAGYLEDDQCSMLTWNGDRCLHKSEFTKTVDGEKYKVNCKQYCQDHCNLALRPLFEQPPRFATFLKNGTNEYIDYFIEIIFIKIVVLNEEITYQWTNLKEKNNLFQIKRKGSNGFFKPLDNNVGFDRAGICDLLKNNEKVHLDIKIVSRPIHNQPLELEDIKDQFKKGYEKYDFDYSKLHMGDINNIDDYKFLFFKSNDLEPKRWLSSVWNIKLGNKTFQIPLEKMGQRIIFDNKPRNAIFFDLSYDVTHFDKK